MKLQGIQYNVKLQKLARAVKKDIDEVIMPLVRQYAPEYVQDSAPIVTADGWSDAMVRAVQFLAAKWVSPIVRQAVETIASDFVQSAMGYSERTMRRTFGINVFQNSSKLQEYVKSATWQNANLISSIPVQYIEQVSNIVMTNMRVGMRPSYIEKALQQQFGVTQRRAKFIARDQTAKVTGEISKQRQVDAGFEYFMWVDSHDQRVRHRHREIANKVTAYGKGVYRWDNLPLSDKGEPIQPGQDYQCRCIGRPVLFTQVKRNQEAGKTQPGVYR